MRTRRKLASPGLPTPQRQSFLKAMGEFAKQPVFMSMLAAPIIGGIAGGIENAMQRSRLHKQKVKSFREMLDLHPHLRERDQKEVHRIYNSLHNASPAMAADPMVAGAWTDNIIENKVPGMNSHQGLLNAVKDLSGIQWSVTQARHKDRGENRMRNYVESQILQVGKGVAEVQRNSLDEAYLAHRRDLEQSVARNNQKYEKDFATIQREKAELISAADALRREQDEVNFAKRRFDEMDQKALEELRSFVPNQPVSRPQQARPGRRIVREMGKTSSHKPDLKSLLAALRV